MTAANYCDDCGGEGGFEVAVATRPPPWGDGADDGYWVECPTCHGSGWIDEEPPVLDMDELDERCGDFAEALP